MKLRLIALFVFLVLSLIAKGANNHLDMLFSGVDQILDYQTFLVVGFFVETAFWVNFAYFLISFFRNVVFLRNRISTFIIAIVFLFNSISFFMAVFASTIDNLDMYLHINEERIVIHVLLLVLFLYLSVAGYLKGRRGEKYQWTLNELGTSSRKADLSLTEN